MTQQEHQSDPRILSRRTLEHDHPHLAPLLRPGMRVLDIGCGTGAITADIAHAVSPGGSVIGVDRDPANLKIARQEHGGLANLSFRHGDLMADDFAALFEAPFDLVNATRMLLWISEPIRALEQMKNVVRPGGRVVALDYSLDDTEWEPEPPRSFLDFYDAFLQWRAENGWDNAMGKNLPARFESAGLTDICTHRCDEVVTRSDPDFGDGFRARIWLYVMESVAPRVITAGFSDQDRFTLAHRQYADYLGADLERQTMFAATVEGVVPQPV